MSVRQWLDFIRSVVSLHWWKSHLMEGHLMQQKRKGYIMQQDHLMKRHR
jgi:hypothetical protein